MKTTKAVKIIATNPINAIKAISWEVKYKTPIFIDYCTICKKPVFEHDFKNKKGQKEFKILSICPSCQKRYGIKRP